MKESGVISEEAEESLFEKINNILDSLVNKKWNPNPKTENTTYSDRENTRTDKYTIYYHTKSNLGGEVYLDVHSLIDEGDRLYTQLDDFKNNISTWPFKRWGGSIDRSMIYPFKKAFLNGKKIKIPNKSIELLENWAGGEYSNGCLLIPPAISHNNWQYKWYKDYIETNVTESEINDLVYYSKNLDKNNLPSFIKYVNNFDKCYKNHLESSHKGQWY